MINFRLCILLLCSFVIAEEYISIELSDSKKKLSQEIFKKLNNEHYIQEIDKDNFIRKHNISDLKNYFNNLQKINSKILMV